MFCVALQVILLILSGFSLRLAVNGQIFCQEANEVMNLRLQSGESLSVVAVGLDASSLSQVRGLIESLPNVWLREINGFSSEADDTLPSERMDICLIDLDRDCERAIRTAQRIHQELRQAIIFAVSYNSQAELIMRAMRSGCAEYLLKPLDRHALLDALARARVKDGGERGRGQVLSFLGAKGGTGVTTVATHLAALLAKVQGRKTLLIDHHPQLGDASYYLDLEKHRYNFYDLVESAGRLDAKLLQGILVQHPSGLHVLQSPDKFQFFGDLFVEDVEHTLEFLRSQYEFVIVDCAPGVDERNMAIIRDSTRLYLVVTPELPALRKAAFYLDCLAKNRLPAEKIRIVLNRHSKNAAVPDERIEETIRSSICWRVPNQYADVMKIINAGAPVSASASSDFTRNLNRWAEILTGKRVEGFDKAETAKKKEAFKGVLNLGEASGR